MKHRDIYDRDIYEDIYETCLLLHCKGRQADIMFHICRYDMRSICMTVFNSHKHERNGGMITVAGPKTIKTLSSDKWVIGWLQLFTICTGQLITV